MRKLAVVDNHGQALLELILAISIASFFLTTFVIGIISVREAFSRTSVSSEAKLLLQKEVEALRSIKETTWNSFSTAGNYHVEQNGNIWEVKPNTIIENNLTHGFSVADVCRLQVNSAIVPCSTPLSISDPATKKITATVNWSFLGTQSISSSLYLTRHAGNTVWTQTTQADFNSGANSNTVVTPGGSGITGAVELSTNPIAGVDYGNKFRVSFLSSLGAMTTSGHKTSMRFTAQTTKTVTAVRVYLNQEQGNSPSYKYGLQADSSGSPSGVFLGSNTISATSTGWQTISLSPQVSITAGTIYHLVVEPSGAPAPNAYIDVASTRALNYLIVKTQTIDSNSNTLFKAGVTAIWSVLNQQPIYELDYSDTTYEGNPFYGLAQTTVAGKTWAGEKFTVTGGNKTVTAITFYVNRNATGTPLDSLWVELRNAATNEKIEDGPMPFLPIPPTSNYVAKTYTFSTQQLLTNGNTYRIILKSPGSIASNGYRVSRLVVDGNLPSYNSITYDGTNSIYTVHGNSGNGMPPNYGWTDSNLRMDIGGFYFTTQANTTYSTTGDFTSSSFNTTLDNSAFNFLNWTAFVPATTGLTLQLAINNDNSTWNYFGPDGTSTTFFTAPTALPLNKINGRYARYKAFFTSNGLLTPTLSDVNINYSP